MKKISVKTAAAISAAIMFFSCAAFAANGAVSAEGSVPAAAEETADARKTRDTYEIGSVSKTVCAVACCRLAEMGKLDLDAPVTEYVPEFRMKDERYKDITVRMLLDHSSGIMGTLTGGCYLVGDDDGSYRELFLERLAEQELKADPGEYGVYCNSGFMLAGIVVERASGMSYGDFLQKEIAEPLGLENFGTAYTGTDRERFVISKTGGRDTDWQNCVNTASGGMWATADDLALFSLVLTEGNDFLSDESKAEIMNIFSDENGFGLGIDDTVLYPYDAYGKKAVFKGGCVGNFKTSLTVLPEDNLSIAVCSQGPYDYFPMMMSQDIILSVLKEEGLISDEDIAKGNARTEEMLTEKECGDIPVPESMKKYEGYYGCRGIYKVGFEENCLTLENIHADFKQVYRFRYAGDGKFCSFDGDYISISAGTGQFGYKNTRNKGTMTAEFTEERGKIFLSASITEEVNGVGVINMDSQLLEKLPESAASEEAIKAWAEREDDLYYLVREPYNSTEYLGSPTFRFTPSEKASWFESLLLRQTNRRKQ